MNPFNPCRLYVLIFLLATSLTETALARVKVQGYCMNGGASVSTSGMSGTPKVQASYPGCTVTVYAAGTLNLAAIYEDNSGTAKANPFTASVTNGLWYYYVDDGRYDTRFSGAGITTPFTIGDISVFDATGGGSSFTFGCGTGQVMYSDSGQHITCESTLTKTTDALGTRILDFRRSGVDVLFVGAVEYAPVNLSLNVTPNTTMVLQAQRRDSTRTPGSIPFDTAVAFTRMTTTARNIYEAPNTLAIQHDWDSATGTPSGISTILSTSSKHTGSWGSCGNCATYYKFGADIGFGLWGGIFQYSGGAAVGLSAEVKQEYIPISGAATTNPVSITVSNRMQMPKQNESVTIIGGTGDWAALNGAWLVTIIDETHFSIPVDATAFSGSLDVTAQAYVTTGGELIGVQAHMLDGSTPGISSSLGFQGLMNYPTGLTNPKGGMFLEATRGTHTYGLNVEERSSGGSFASLGRFTSRYSATPDTLRLSNDYPGTGLAPNRISFFRGLSAEVGRIESGNIVAGDFSGGYLDFFTSFGGTARKIYRIDSAGGWLPWTPVSAAGLATYTPAKAGTQIYCYDCNSTCGGGGLGTWATWSGSVWSCGTSIPGGLDWVSQIYNKPFVDVRQYGAKGDGSTDDTAAIKAAIVATPAGGMLFFPVGTFIIDASNISISNANVTIMGTGSGSVIKAKSGASLTTMLTLLGTADGATIRDLVFDGNVAGGGTVENSIGYMLVAVADKPTLDNVEVKNGGRIGLYFASTATNPLNDLTIRNSYFHDIGSLTSAAGIGVGVFGGSGDGGTTVPSRISITNSRFERIYNKNSDPNDSSAINVEAINVLLDGNYVEDNHNVSGGQVAITRNAADCSGLGYWKIVHNTFSLTGAFGTEATAGVELCGEQWLVGDNVFKGGSWDAVRVEGKANEGVVSGNVINSVATGVNFIDDGSGNGSANVVVSNNRISATTAISSQSAHDILINGNDFTGSTTVLYGGSGANIKLHNNHGMTLGTSTITPGASPYTYTSGHLSERVYITGGTVSAVSRNGTNICTASPCFVDLMPNSAVVVTYSSAPTMVKDLIQ